MPHPFVKLFFQELDWHRLGLRGFGFWGSGRARWEFLKNGKGTEVRTMLHKCGEVSAVLLNSPQGMHHLTVTHGTLKIPWDTMRMPG
eukprot:2587967-Amphidinium_carterae.1